MTAPAVERLAYRDPHAPRRGQPYTSPYTLADLEALRNRFWDDPYVRGDLTGPYSRFRAPEGHVRANAKPGWHGPLPAPLHAEHEARELQVTEERHTAHIAQLALQARRDANPMWERLDDVMPRERCDEDVDAVMDVVYGEGHW